MYLQRNNLKENSLKRMMENKIKENFNNSFSLMKTAIQDAITLKISDGEIADEIIRGIKDTIPLYLFTKIIKKLK